MRRVTSSVLFCLVLYCLVFSIVLPCLVFRLSCTGLSRKLAVANWSYSCSSKGNTVFFSLETPPLLPPSSGGILKRSWKQMVKGQWLEFCWVSRQSVFSMSKACQNPIIVPGSYDP
jgi:hypothetical protein